MPDFIAIGNPLVYKYKTTYVNLFTLRYDYTGCTNFIQDNYFTYSYSGNNPSLTNKLMGWRSDYTQIIANSLQDWNRIRQCPSSTGQYYINSMAISIDELNRYWRVKRKELFLETADIGQPSHLGRVPLPDSIQLGNVPDNNLLINGGINYESIPRYNIPEGWTTRWANSTGIIRYDTTDSLIAGGSVYIETPISGVSYISQSHNYFIPKDTPLTLSVWYKNDINDNYPSNSSSYLQLLCTNPSGYVKISSKELDVGTNYQWKRAAITYTTPEDVGKIEVRVEVNNTGSTYNKWYRFDAFQLEQLDHISPFSNSIYDLPEWMKVMNIFTRPTHNIEVLQNKVRQTGYYCTGYTLDKFPVFYIADKDLFLSNSLIPTRIKSHPTTGGINSTSNVIHGIYTSSNGTLSEKGWNLWGNTGLFTYEFPNKTDVGNRYYINDYGVDQGVPSINTAFNVTDLYLKRTISVLDSQQLNLGYNLNLVDFTIQNGLIWALGYESYTGITNTILKVINPRTEYNSIALETIREFYLTGITGVTSISFVQNNPKQILISLTGNNLQYSGRVVTLYYDYYTIDPTTRQAFTRELYTGSNELVMIY